jgi:putative membrane protein
MLTLKKSTAVAACLIFFSCSNEQKTEQREEKKESQEEKSVKASDSDAQRVTEIHMLNLYTFMASEAAKTKAVTAQVKNLADSLKINHAQIDADLQALALRKSIALPSELSNEKKRRLDELGEKENILFCKEYVQQMKDTHEDLLKTCEKLSENGDDAEIKLWGATAVPHMRMHLEMIERSWEFIKNMKKDLKYNNKTYR